MDRDKIDQAITKCRECRLCHERKNPVPGEGGTDVTIMLVGEAPGREEDMQGRPFVGRAGNLLDAMLQSGGLARKDVFITNAVKCRPPHNRAPKRDEVAACSHFLLEQIAIIRPMTISPMGNVSTAMLANLFQIEGEPKKLRCKISKTIINGMEVKVFPVYHPGASLHNPPIKKEVERSFQLLADVVRRP